MTGDGTHSLIHIYSCWFVLRSRSIQWLVLGKGVISPHLSSNPNSPGNAHDLSWNTGLVAHSSMPGDDWQRLLASTYGVLFRGEEGESQKLGALSAQIWPVIFFSFLFLLAALGSERFQGLIIIIIIILIPTVSFNLPCAWGSFACFFVFFGSLAVTHLIILGPALQYAYHYIILWLPYDLLYSIFRPGTEYLYGTHLSVSSAVVTDTDHSIDNNHTAHLWPLAWVSGKSKLVCLNAVLLRTYHPCTTIWPFCRLILQVTAADDYLYSLTTPEYVLRESYSRVVMEYCPVLQYGAANLITQCGSG